MGSGNGKGNGVRNGVSHHFIFLIISVDYADDVNMGVFYKITLSTVNL